MLVSVTIVVLKIGTSKYHWQQIFWYPLTWLHDSDEKHKTNLCPYHSTVYPLYSRNSEVL